MRKIVSFVILLITVCTLNACFGETNQGSSATTKTAEGTNTPNNYLRERVLSSDFPLPKAISADSIQVEVDRDENNAYFCRVYFETAGTGTLGWVKYDANTDELFDITDADHPVKLRFKGDASAEFPNSPDAPTQEALTKLPFEQDTFFEECLSKGIDDRSKESVDTYRDYEIEGNAELKQLFSSQWNYSPSTYLVLSKNETFALYLFEALDQRGEDVELIPILATIKDGKLLSSMVLNEPYTTFSVAKDLSVSLFQTVEKETGEITEEGATHVSVRGDLIRTYSIHPDGTIVLKEN